MGKVKKEAKDAIIKLMLQEVSTEDIAKKLNYSVGTIRNVFEELREEYGVSSKMGITTAYLRSELEKVNNQLNRLFKIMDNCDFEKKNSCFNKKYKRKHKK